MSIIKFFENKGIPYFYELQFKKEKNWFGMLSTIIIGAFEIALGVILAFYMSNDFWPYPGRINNIQNINFLIGKDDFDWKELGKKELSFAFNLAINIAISFIRGNLKFLFIKKNKNITKKYYLVTEKVKAKFIKMGTNIGVQLFIDIFGKDFILSIVAKFKDISKKITNSIVKEQI
jgi:hypothetical protein